jgi:hypothetical protein
MQVFIEFFGLPALAVRRPGCSALSLEQNTLAALIERLSQELGDSAGKLLLGEDGNLDPEILILVNDREVTGSGAFSLLRLAEGDHIKFILMVGGG